MSLILVFNAVTNLSDLQHVLHSVIFFFTCREFGSCAFNKDLDVRIKSLIMQIKTKLSEQAMIVSLFKLNHFHNNKATKFFDEVRNISKFICKYMYFKWRFTVFVQAIRISMTFMYHFHWEIKLFLSMINILLSRSKYFC